ncbi:MAG: hypothetical protein U0Y68_19080 [Blastocatellia bacterium]
MQKARETGDFSLNARAEAALNRSLAVNANTATENYDALRLQATLHLTYHRFADALVTGQQMQKLRPDDHYAYGVLTDALVELGRYPEAVTAADKMADLRPDATSYARISSRTLHGYPEQAIEAMRMAVRASSPRDAENHAWYRVQLGQELLNACHIKEAERNSPPRCKSSPIITKPWRQWRDCSCGREISRRLFRTIAARRNECHRRIPPPRSVIYTPNRGAPTKPNANTIFSPRWNVPAATPIRRKWRCISLITT